MRGFEKLKNSVIDRGLCTGCGTCAGICRQNAIKIELIDMEPLPVLKGECINCGNCELICPGKTIPLMELERNVFGKQRTLEQPDLGVYKELGIGYALDKEIRKHGSSGGLVTAILIYAFKTKLIDAVIVAGFDKKKPIRTKAIIAKTVEDILDASQSKYTVVPINKLLLEAAKDNNRIGIVGLPCHIQALRKLEVSRKDLKLSNTISYIFGLFCASQFYFEGTRHILAEWGNIQNINRIGKLEYRGGGWPGHMIAKDEFGEEKVIDRHQYMYHMLMPCYKKDRCEMCIDWSSELSDISFGDYWLSKDNSEGGFTSYIIRSNRGKELFNGCIEKGIINAKEIKEGDKGFFASSAGYEMKKHAAAYRLKQRQYFGWPTPDYDYIPNHNPFYRKTRFTPESKDSE